MPTLVFSKPLPHNFTTRGQSRGGGVGTSESRRRSNVFGRVAVTYVQGTPKGGGALGLLGVPNTRLASVPPNVMEVGTRMTGNSKQSSRPVGQNPKARSTQFAGRAAACAAVACLMLTPTMSLAQQSSYEQREREDRIATIAGYIRSNPDHACSLPKRDLEQYLTAEANRHGLIDNVNQSVFDQSKDAPAPTGYAALLDKVRQDTARRHATAQAIANGTEAPVGDNWKPPEETYDVAVAEISAASRLDNGLKCVATVMVEKLQVPIAYDLFLDPSEADGWTARGDFPTFTEAAALDEATPFRVDYYGWYLPLGEARERARLDRAKATAERVSAERQAAARDAYRNSPAGQAEILRQQRAMAEKQKACEASGGTWGVPYDRTTIVRIDAMQARGYLAAVQGCFFLNR